MRDRGSFGPPAHQQRRIGGRAVSFRVGEPMRAVLAASRDGVPTQLVVAL
jgi:hypothetical protein